MNKLIMGLLLSMALLTGTAEARGHYHKRYHQVHQYVHKTYHTRVHNAAYYGNGEGRPSGCGGIPWCGCWLRHEFGINDTSLNLAAEWRRRGSPATPETANVVVWPNGHHVGKLLSVKDGQMEVISGNYGNRVATRWFRITKGFIFRRV